MRTEMVVLRRWVSLVKDTLIVALCVFTLLGLREGRGREDKLCEVPRSYYAGILRTVLKEGRVPNGSAISFMFYPSLDAYEAEHAGSRMRGADRVRGRPVFVWDAQRRTPLPRGAFGLTHVTYVFDVASPSNYYVRCVE